jgi:hypothetical protein
VLFIYSNWIRKAEKSKNTFWDHDEEESNELPQPFVQTWYEEKAGRKKYTDGPRGTAEVVPITLTDDDEQPRAKPPFPNREYLHEARREGCLLKGFQKIGEKCYFYGSFPLNWFKALEFCNSLGLEISLAAIETRQEDDELKRWIAKQGEASEIWKQRTLTRE